MDVRYFFQFKEMEWNHCSLQKYAFYTNNKFLRNDHSLENINLYYYSVVFPIRKKIFSNMTLKLITFHEETWKAQ